MSWWCLAFALIGVHLTRCQFHECHDDPTYDPEEGPLRDMRFTWLGVLQYIHVKNGTPHFFRMPRVVLISREYVLSTAADAAQVPDGYALGNVAFGEYERDEEECGITPDMMGNGVVCENAALLVPLSDVLLHPEYNQFDAQHSLALLRMILPIKSRYMLPACLPLKDYFLANTERQRMEGFFHLDYESDVPRDFSVEEKEVSKLKLLPRELCDLYGKDNSTDVTNSRAVCTSGCGFHSGAPSIVHEHTGQWTLVALSQGSATCPDPLRSSRPPAPPHHTVIFPYVPWISKTITGIPLEDDAKNDPFGFVKPRTLGLESRPWAGHWWMGGIRCFDRGEASADLFRFYHEVFHVMAEELTALTYFLNIFSPYSVAISCVKVGMQYYIEGIKIWGLETREVKVYIPVYFKLHGLYRFQVEGWGRNRSKDSRKYYSKSSSRTSALDSETSDDR